MEQSKYKRWTRRMDAELVGFLASVVYSPSGPREITKGNWKFVCYQLRSRYPHAVYSTFTKYSCHQHLLNVIYYQYKIWKILCDHCTNIDDSAIRYTYLWSSDLGRFLVTDTTTNLVVNDDFLIKRALNDDTCMHMPRLDNLRRGTVIANDLFLTNNYAYLETFSSRLLESLSLADSRFREHREDLQKRLPILAPSTTAPPAVSSPAVATLFPSDPVSNPSSGAIEDANSPERRVDLARQRSTPGRINEVTESNPSEGDGSWVMKLIELQRANLLTAEEVISVCQGVRDGKIPSFMLGVFEPESGADVGEQASRIRDFLVPLSRNSR